MKLKLKQILRHKYALLGSFIVAILCFSSLMFSINRAKHVPNAISIRTEEDFYKINNNLSGYYVLADSIIFSKPIQPIGSPEHPFTGTFDGLSKYGLKNIIFDFEKIDLDKYTSDGVTNIGLFSYNKGVIIHNEVTGISFLNVNSLTDKKVNIGTLCGKNEGKLTSNVLYTPNGATNFSDANEVRFGLFCGHNSGDIRRDKIIGHINCSFSSVNSVNCGGFSGFSGEKSVHEMLQFNGNISIYNTDDTAVDNISCGTICGTLNGGEILNCDLQKASVLNMKKNCNISNCGGAVGFIDSGSATVSISSCAITGVIRSSALSGNYISSCIGRIKSIQNLELSNLLIGGECTSYYVTATEEMISDAYYSETKSFTLKNCKVLDNYQIKNPCIKHIHSVVSLNEISLVKMGWDDAYWSIEKGVIHLKVFDL